MDDRHLELLDKEDGGGVGLEAVGELESAVEEAYGAIIASEGDPPPPARAALDLAGDLAGDRGLPGGLLVEELELPPLVHLPCLASKTRDAIGGADCRKP